MVIGSTSFISHGFRSFGRGPTTRSLGDENYPWLLTTYESWNDPPSGCVFFSLRATNLSSQTLSTEIMHIRISHVNSCPKFKTKLVSNLKLKRTSTEGDLPPFDHRLPFLGIVIGQILVKLDHFHKYIGVNTTCI